MSRAVLSLVALCAAILVACGGSQRATRADGDRRDALVLLECAVPDAVVWVNGREVRQIRDLAGGMALSPGTHRIEVRHDDYHAAYLEVTVGPDERKTVRVELAPVLD